MRFLVSSTLGRLLLVLSAAVPQHLLSQDRPVEVSLRNDCRLARQVLVHGQPANKYDWALGVIEDCGTEGAAAIAHELRDLRNLQSRSVHLDHLVEVAQRLIDPELFHVALEIAADEQAGEAARIQAIRLFTSQVADVDLPYEALITDPIETGRVIFGPATSRGPTVLRELPLQACADASRLLQRLAAEATLPMIRLAADQAYYTVEYACRGDEAAE